MGIFAFFALQQKAGIRLVVCMLTAFAQQTARARLHGRTVDIYSKYSTNTALMQQHQFCGLRINSSARQQTDAV
jgi:hypothetical protein